MSRRYDSQKKTRTAATPNYAKKRAYFPISYSIAEEFLMASSKEAKMKELKPPPGVILKSHNQSDSVSSSSSSWPPVAFPNPTANVFYGFARDRSVVCTLRPAGRGSMDVRKSVLKWVAEAAKEWGLHRFIAGEVDHGGNNMASMHLFCCTQCENNPCYCRSFGSTHKRTRAPCDPEH